jgi:acetylornithine/succinyldiaminopimelate/putrescine aminotransferase
MGDEYWRNAFRPLLPGVLHLDYNSFEQLEQLSEHTACVIVETVQAENGVIKPRENPDRHQSVNRQPSTVNKKNWLQALRKKCDDCGVLLIMDEIQVGFGRTGTLWGFEQYGVVPDILLLGKALGGGLPLGAFVAAKHLMDTLMDQPVLGHITTFGGHPLSCAAGLASMKVLLNDRLVESVMEKEEIFRRLLVHPAIKSVRSAGLLIAVEFESFEKNKQVIDYCIQQGLLTDWFLFASNCLRIAPPLTISPAEIVKACMVILDGLNG